MHCFHRGVNAIVFKNCKEHPCVRQTSTNWGKKVIHKANTFNSNTWEVEESVCQFQINLIPIVGPL